MHAKFHRGGFRSFESGSRFVSESQFCKCMLILTYCPLGLSKIFIYMSLDAQFDSVEHGFYTYSLILLKPPHGYTRTKMWVIG